MDLTFRELMNLGANEHPDSAIRDRVIWVIQLTRQGKTPEEAMAITNPHPDFVTITWTEIRTYHAVVPYADLAEVVTQPGPVETREPGSEGHPMPARLSELEGDPFRHGNLNGLLCDLEPGSLTEVDGITVESVRARPGWTPSA